MGKTYKLTIVDASVPDGEPTKFLAYSYGDVDVMSYVARKAVMVEDKDYGVVLIEVDSVKGETVRRVLSVEGDAEVVQVMLSKKIRKERKEADESETANEGTEAGAETGIEITEVNTETVTPSRRGRRPVTEPEPQVIG